MKTAVTHTTEVVGGKEYPLTVTRQGGAREAAADEKPVQAAETTVFDSPLGRSRCRTGPGPEITPEERAAVRRQIQETAVRAMVEQGIW